MAAGQGGEQVEHVRTDKVHAVQKAVAGCIVPGHVHRRLAHIHGGDVLRPAVGGVEGKAPGVGEAVQHPPPPGQTGHRPAVIFLVQEKPGFLAVFKVYVVKNTVFTDGGMGGLRRRLPGEREPALALRQALPGAEGGVVSLIDAPDLLPVLPQHVCQQRENHILPLLHAVGEGLGYQGVVEAVHSEAGELVGLAEDEAAAVELLRGQYRLSIGPGILDPPPPEGGVKLVVGVAAEEPDADLAGQAQQAGAQVAAPAAADIHQRAVFRCVAGELGDLLGVDPGMAGGDAVLGFLCDGIGRIWAALFHVESSLSRALRPDIAAIIPREAAS